MNGRRLPLALLAGIAVFATIAMACTPGGETPDVSAPPVPTRTGVVETGPITLTVWDQECCQVSKVWDQLNAEFEQEYPNVTIKRVNRDFGELKALLRLAIAGPKGPDIVEVNQGWPDMGQLVKAGLLLPLDNFAEAYGWTDRVSENVLAVSRWSPDGAQFGTGNLYGYTTFGEIIGVYYNARKLEDLGLAVPTTFDGFEQALAAAKQAGEVPIQFGNNDAFPGIHEYVVIEDQTAEVGYLTDLVFGLHGTDLSFDTPENLAAATTLQDWARKGYFTPGFGGGGYDDAVANFADGEGVFMITGNWIVESLGADSPDFGFFVMPPMDAGAPPVATGGAGFPLSIAAGAEHPDAAAAYVDWMTSDHAADLLLPTGQIPLRIGTPVQAEEGTVLADVVGAAASVSDANGMVPYLDWATPTFYDTTTAAIQELMADRITPQEFVSRIDADYVAFQSSRG
ncbi:MAG TPA: extracellular solute-binding protein [Actinomycetota bacterium]|nr:extracellular solute-binding protein [Actinomycetota bacterium]